MKRFTVISASISTLLLFTGPLAPVSAQTTDQPQPAVGAGEVNATLVGPDGSVRQPPAPPQGGATPLSRISVDAFGDYHYSRFNFTDLRHPYNAIDGYSVVRLQGWLDTQRRVGGYVNVIPSIATADEFFFQRYVEADCGVQAYFFRGPLGPLRLFAELDRRSYYDERPGAFLPKSDRRFGADYYYDNLLADSALKLFIFANGTFRSSNFSLDNYDAWVTTGNLKWGPAIASGSSQLIPYAVADWTRVAHHDDRFWENFLRAGPGIRWYPRTMLGPGWSEDLVRRFHLYSEVLRNVAWIGNEAPPSIERWDLRFGVGFATPGLLRQSK